MIRNEVEGWIYIFTKWITYSHHPADHRKTVIFVRNLTPNVSTVIIGPGFGMRILRIGSELNTSETPRGLTKGCMDQWLPSLKSVMYIVNVDLEPETTAL